MSVNDSIQADYDEAMQALADEEMDAARACLRRMLKSHPDDHRTLELSGDFARLRGEFDKADKLYQRMTTASDSKEVLALSLISRGILCAEQDRRDDACDLFRKAIPIYRELGETSRLINACGSLGDTLLEAGHLKESADAYREGLTVAKAEFSSDPEEEEQNQFLTAILERDLGQVCRMLGELDLAVEHFHQAMAHFERLEDEVQFAQTLDCLSVVRQIQGQYDEAEALLLKAIAINEEHGEEEGLSVNFGNMAFLKKHLKAYDEAEEYLKKAYAIDKESGRADAIADYHTQLGSVLYERGQFADAETNLLKSMKLHKEIDNLVGIAAAHSHLGVLYRLKKDYSQSEKMTLKALEIAESIEHLDFIAGVLDELAMLRKMQDRPEEAREIWNRSLTVFERLRSERMIAEVRQQLAELTSG